MTTPQSRSVKILRPSFESGAFRMEVRNAQLEPICLVLRLLYLRLFTGEHLDDTYHNLSSEKNIVFFLVSWGGVKLSPLGTSATNWFVLPAPDDR
jgi:hypothetical protein